ncbi:MAG: hypothetical protein A2Y86_06170, partial [Candidatus Aminicenantes bacterium RBG_13_62_12]
MTHMPGVNKAHLPRAIWTGVSLLSISILLSFWWPFQAERLVPLAQSVVLVLLSFACGYVDSSLGMGYGSTLTPILLLLGYRPLEVVPAIIASQFAAGGIGAWAHHLIGNVDLHPRNRAFRVACLLASASVLGTGIGAMVAVYLPALYLQAWVGLLVCFIGIVTLALRRRQTSFSWKRIIALGVFAAFNKGSTGGGYGPIVMGGQLLAGVSGKNAVGITTLAESLSCIVGVITYLLAPGEISWRLSPFLILGAVA